MLRLAEGTQIYVADKPVDFRKAINGLAVLVVERFATPVNDGSVYVFYNHDCTRIKCLFHGNDVGARAGSILFSFVETCKQNKVEVFSWFKYVLTNIHKALTIEQLEKLLPYNIDRQLLYDMRSIPNLIIPEKKGDI